MPSPARYLHFNNLDVQEPSVNAQCSACGQEFKTEVQPGEHIAEAVHRVREDYNEHECRSA